MYLALLPVARAHLNKRQPDRRAPHSSTTRAPGTLKQRPVSFIAGVARVREGRSSLPTPTDLSARERAYLYNMFARKWADGPEQVVSEGG